MGGCLLTGAAPGTSPAQVMAAADGRCQVNLILGAAGDRDIPAVPVKHTGLRPAPCDPSHNSRSAIALQPAHLCQMTEASLAHLQHVSIAD